MLFKQKVQTVGTISEFMNRGREKEELHESELTAFEKAKSSAGIIGGLSLLPLVAPMTEPKVALAASTTYDAIPVMATDAMYEKMVTAFDPLIVLVQSLAYPIATVVVLGGAIMVMVGMKEKGYSLMMSAGLGYVLVNMTPMVLNILVEAMKAV